MPVNFDVLKTPQGLVKAISVGCGFMSMAFICAAFDQGRWYHEEEGARFNRFTGVVETYRINYETDCKQPGAGNDAACPPSWLVITSMVLIILTWLITLVSLIGHLFTGTKNLLQSTDPIVQVISGLVLLLATGFTVGFIVMVFLKLDCENNGASARSAHISISARSLGIGGDRRSRSGFQSDQKRDGSDARHNVPDLPLSGECTIIRTWFFQEVLLILSVVLSLAAGATCIIAGVLKPSQPRRMGGQQNAQYGGHQNGQYGGQQNAQYGGQHNGQYGTQPMMVQSSTYQYPPPQQSATASMNAGPSSGYSSQQAM